MFIQSSRRSVICLFLHLAKHFPVNYNRIFLFQCVNPLLFELALKIAKNLNLNIGVTLWGIYHAAFVNEA